MRKIRAANHTIDTIFVLVLFCVFTAAILMVLLSGANAYQTIASKMEEQYAERTCLSYLDAKIRHYDEIGMVGIESFGDAEALALYEDLEGIRYKTLIYFIDGYVWELFFENGLQFQPEDGQKIIPAQDLQIERKTNDLLYLTCISKDGQKEQLIVYLHSGEGVDVYE